MAWKEVLSGFWDPFTQQLSELGGAPAGVALAAFFPAGAALPCLLPPSKASIAHFPSRCFLLCMVFFCIAR